MCVLVCDGGCTNPLRHLGKAVPLPVPEKIPDASATVEKGVRGLPWKSRGAWVSGSVGGAQLLRREQSWSVAGDGAEAVACRAAGGAEWQEACVSRRARCRPGASGWEQAASRPVLLCAHL